MPTCGIVDVGSNTIRLSIYQYDSSGFKLLLNKKEMAGLAGYVKNGCLSDDGIHAAIRVLSDFRFLLENLHISEFHVFATASLRNITNTETALSAISDAANIPISVISGAEEASLSFLGALHGVQADAAGVLTDIGGGSTEIVIYENNVIKSETSLPIGSLSLYAQYVSELFPTQQEIKKIRRHVQQALKKTNDSDIAFSHLRGVGGTIRAAGKLEGVKPGQSIPSKTFRQLYHNLKSGDQSALQSILRFAPERIHTLLPGLIILNAILKTYHIKTVDISTCGVREGYLLHHVMGEEAPHVQGA